MFSVVEAAKISARQSESQKLNWTEINSTEAISLNHLSRVPQISSTETKSSEKAVDTRTAFEDPKIRKTFSSSDDQASSETTEIPCPRNSGLFLKGGVARNSESYRKTSGVNKVRLPFLPKQAKPEQPKMTKKRVPESKVDVAACEEETEKENDKSEPVSSETSESLPVASK